MKLIRNIIATMISLAVCIATFCLLGSFFSDRLFGLISTFTFSGGVAYFTSLKVGYTKANGGNLATFLTMSIIFAFAIYNVYWSITLYGFFSDMSYVYIASTVASFGCALTHFLGVFTVLGEKNGKN